MSRLEILSAPLQRPDRWAASNSHCCVRYRLLADAQPATLCQVLNLLAMQYLVPSAVNVLRQGEDLHIEVDVDGLSWHRAQVIGEKMRNLIDIADLELQNLDLHAQAEENLILASA